MFATKGFMLALHVPSSFVRYKNRLTRALYRVGKSATVSPKANYLEDSNTTDYDISSKATIAFDKEEDPISIIKTRLAKGKISKEEYEELRKAMES